VYIAFSESYPWAALFRDVLQNLRAPLCANVGETSSPG
jgi:hypothetical protein